MRGAVVRRFRSVALLTCGVVFSALSFGTTLAHAADKQKVIVEQFGGPSSDKLRAHVLKAIDKTAGFDAIPDKKVAAVEADLGLMQTSDAYGAVARELKASGFVRGTVSGGKKAKVKLVVRDADGNTVGEDSWSGHNPAKAVDAASKGLASSLASMLGKLKGAPSGGGGGAVAKAEKPAKTEPKAEKAEEKAAAADDDEAKKSKKKAVAKSDDEDEEDTAGAAPAPSDADVRASAAADEERPSGRSGGANWTGLDATFGVHVYSRKFTYNNVGSDGSTVSRGDQQEYDLSAAPALALSADYFFLPYVGVTVGGEWTPPVLVSKDGSGVTYSTASYIAGGGVKGKFGLGAVELTPSVIGQIHRFSVDPKDPTAGTAPRVAPVQYTIARPGIGARVNVGSFAIVAGAGYLFVADPGGIKTDYFPNAKAQGFDGFAGAAFGLPFMPGLEARVMLDVRRYVFAMNSAAGDQRITGGAIDQYLGANLGIGWRAGR